MSKLMERKQKLSLKFSIMLLFHNIFVHTSTISAELFENQEKGKEVKKFLPKRFNFQGSDEISQVKSFPSINHDIKDNDWLENIKKPLGENDREVFPLPTKANTERWGDHKRTVSVPSPLPFHYGSHRMFQLQNYYNMLKNNQQRRLRLNNNSNNDNRKKSVPSEESEPKYYHLVDQFLPTLTFGMNPRRDSAEYKNQIQSELMNGSELFGKRNIFLSKGWGTGGSMDMNDDLDKYFRTPTYPAQKSYIFTSNHWGPLGKRNKQVQDPQ